MSDPRTYNPNPMPPEGMTVNMTPPTPDSVIISNKQLKKIKRRWLWALPAFGLGLAIGLASSSTPEAGPVQTLPTLAPSTQGHVTPGQKKVAPKPKVTTFMPQDGTYLVGENIAPGTYRNGNEPSCVWSRLKGTSGDFDDIITTGIGPNQVVTISKTDRAFQVSGCGGWVLVKK